MRKFFIDCGGYTGDSIKKFKLSGEYTNDFVIYSFEPISRFYDCYKDSGATVINKAVWINNDELPFYIDKTSDIARGSSLIRNKTSGKLDKLNPIMVKCMDFSEWIIKKFDRNDYIILKMDIEGAEYDVLNKMILDGSINYINKAYIEFHWKKINLPKLIHNKLILDLKKISGFKLMGEYSK